MHASAIRAGVALDSRCMHATLVSKGGVADVWGLRQRSASEPGVQGPRQALKPRYLLLAHALCVCVCGCTYVYFIDVYLCNIVLYLYIYICIHTIYVYIYIHIYILDASGG